jgi:hypothetical protein
MVGFYIFIYVHLWRRLIAGKDEVDGLQTRGSDILRQNQRCRIRADFSRGTRLVLETKKAKGIIILAVRLSCEEHSPADHP